MELQDFCGSSTAGAFLMGRFEAAAQTCLAFLFELISHVFFNNSLGVVWPLSCVPPWVPESNREDALSPKLWGSCPGDFFSWQNSRLCGRNRHKFKISWGDALNGLSLPATH